MNLGKQWYGKWRKKQGSSPIEELPKGMITKNYLRVRR